MNRTFLVCLEGIDGSGKTTIAQELCRHLVSEGVSAQWHHYQFPVFGALECLKSSSSRGGGDETPLNGRQLRGPVLQALAFADGLVGSLRELLKRPMEGVAVYDRYLYDHLANYLLDAPEPVPRLFVAIVKRPDLTILLDLEAELAFARKGEGILDERRRLRYRYLRLLELLPRSRIIRVDAAAPLNKAIEEVLRIVRASMAAPGKAR